MLVNAMAPAEQANGDLVNGLTYTDAAEISKWAENSVAVVTRKGIMRGKSPARFDPKGSATRAEAAVVILRGMERMGLIGGYYQITCSAGKVAALLAWGNPAKPGG